MIRYISTRGNAPAVSATEALLNGIAPDGGLYVPDCLPQIARDSILDAPDYAAVMEILLTAFFDDMPAELIRKAIAASLARFDCREVAPLTAVGGNVYFLDLFHGPTFAFKDVALTLLPHFLQYAVEKSGLKKALVLTATSGDTGSAAESGFAGVAGTEILVFFPQVGTSEIQRRQMVCNAAANVHVCAIEGNFDNAQAGVKAAFADPDLRALAAQKGIFLSSANSINIGRLFPQICYYLDTWRRLAKQGVDEFDVVVPTGNFGNILAARFAKKLGAPIRRLVSASNQNNVIADFIKTGVYDCRSREFFITNSPSMDILISSNLERMVFELAGADGARTAALMNRLKNEGHFELDAREHARLRELFDSGWATQEATEDCIRILWEQEKYLADPHTAIAWKVLRDLRQDGVPAVIAATASPWKFPATLLRALTGTAASDNDFQNLKTLESLTGQPAPATLAHLETAAIAHNALCPKTGVAAVVKKML
ncbi:MAG: threonine synthase [Opitutales bacterium]|nr:threonine synthase [Opitutales bacterium]